MKKGVLSSTVIISIVLVATLSALSSSKFLQIEAKADTQSGYSFGDPVILFEVPNERQVGFYIDYYKESYMGSNILQLGDVVYLMLKETHFRAGSFPTYANATLVVSDDMGNVVWTHDEGPVGKVWCANPSSSGSGFYWRPDAVGNYTLGIIFEGLIYDGPNDFSNAVSIIVCRPGLFFGKVTNGDNLTAINNALVEGLVSGFVKANTTTDDEGVYSLALEEGGVYDVRVSAPGYTSVIQRRVNTGIESQCLNFSLAPSDSDENSSSLVTTSSSITLEPSTCEVNQTVKITMLVEPAPPTPADIFLGISLTIISPDGHTYRKGPYSTNPNGSQTEFFTPDQSGNYTFQFRYHGQVLKSGTAYEASESPKVTLNVNPKPDEPHSSTKPSNQTLTLPLPPTASSVAGAIPSHEALSIPETEQIQQTDQFPTTSVLAVIASISVASTGLPVYFKKRRR